MNLADPEILKRFLRRHGLSPDKGLGQHFLCDLAVVEAIVGSIGGARSALEIGPGPGVLTGPVSEKVDQTVVLELDPRMAKLLAESAPAASIRQEDALKADLRAILAGLPAPRAVVSNLPYYITSPLLTRIAEVREEIDVAVLMMQKEVGQRISAPARSGDRGSLSVYLQACFEISHVANVSAASFLPPPKVDSVVLRFVPKHEGVPSEEVFAFVRDGFTQPRKTLANNFGATRKLSREAVVGALKELGLPDTARAQELSLDEWVRLAALLP